MIGEHAVELVDFAVRAVAVALGWGGIHAHSRPTREGARDGVWVGELGREACSSMSQLPVA
jgi:hypothetical protein